MPFTLWSANRVISILLYISVILLTAWGGTRAINYSIDSKFYKDFLVKWEVSIKTYNHIQAQWPGFTGDNHVPYMDQLVHDMQRNQIVLPLSNTQFSYIYIMDKIGPGHQKCKIFVLCFPDKMILYDLPQESFERIDRFIDGRVTPNMGQFQGRPGKLESIYTCIWKF